ncbi:hypothetical protein GXW83_17335 [Streptacidiphilus sp. PB12-B1b]|uniref:DUF5994 family protein n=1 Tax=Streptacidiphilus sp. PB12-B1b TaxID=2705012 RepID=UPI0015FD6322|nr:DUF5994 family protein [Streptacidiphilus sp. PB12-B1b]QMU77208.1 hypothetical protein GXW83_17335 [Streptacidiphilus sp. PB12-B1b]
MTTVLTTPPPAVELAPPLRLSLTPSSKERCRLDGVWWPHSRDLQVELPSLLAEADHRWGRITHATVNRHLWPSIPYEVRTGTHAVRLGWYDAEQDPYEITLLSYNINRWDLLVLPPETEPGEARRIMASASLAGNLLSPSAVADPGSTNRWGAARWDATAPRDWQAEAAESEPLSTPADGIAVGAIR